MDILTAMSLLLMAGAIIVLMSQQNTVVEAAIVAAIAVAAGYAVEFYARQHVIPTAGADLELSRDMLRKQMTLVTLFSAITLVACLSRAASALLAVTTRFGRPQTYVCEVIGFLFFAVFLYSRF